MSILVVGSVAHDSVTTPFGRVDEAQRRVERTLRDVLGTGRDVFDDRAVPQDAPGHFGLLGFWELTAAERSRARTASKSSRFKGSSS